MSFFFLFRDSGQSNLKPTHKFTQCELAIGIFLLWVFVLFGTWNLEPTNSYHYAVHARKSKRQIEQSIQTHTRNHWKVKTGEKCIGIGKNTKSHNQTKEWNGRKQCVKRGRIVSHIQKAKWKWKMISWFVKILCKHFEEEVKYSTAMLRWNAMTWH